MDETQKRVQEYLRAHNYTVRDIIEIGATSDVFLVQKQKTSYVIKTANSKGIYPSTTEREYKLLSYLAATPVQLYIPRVYGWMTEVQGFLSEYLKYPKSLSDPSYVIGLADALTVLHDLDPNGIESFLPNQHNQIVQSNELLYQPLDTLLRLSSGSSYMTQPLINCLVELQDKRSRYRSLADHIHGVLECLKPSLTHGDLSGDNLMIRTDFSPVLIDWANARISYGILDIANLFVYSEWESTELELFLSRYKGSDLSRLHNAVSVLDRIIELCRYRACVFSLNLAMNNDLDSIGQSFFERQLEHLLNKGEKA